MNISIYSPFSGSTYVELLRRLKYSMKALINIKNNEKKAFFVVISDIKIHPEKITKVD